MSKDEFFIGPKLGPGRTAAVRRTPEGKTSVCAIEVIPDGKPINGRDDDVYYLEKGEGSRCLVGEKVLEGRKGGKGPSNVASDAYRDGWERVFN